MCDEIKKGKRKREEVLTMASVEPSTNHLVMSPLWMTREEVDDRGKRATPSDDALEEASMEALRKR